MKCNNYNVSLRKTTKVEVKENSFPLPPDLGPLGQEFKVADYYTPDEWSKDGIFIEVKEGEPLWIDLRGNDESAVLCSIQRLNPVTGEASDLEGGLKKEPKQNYLKLPEQLWLDGYSNDGKVYQFVVTKAGEGLAVNEYVLPAHMRDSHALGFAFYAPKNPKPKQTVVYRTVNKYQYGDPNWWFGNQSWNNGQYLGDSMPLIGSSGDSNSISFNASTGEVPTLGKRFLRCASANCSTDPAEATLDYCDDFTTKHDTVNLLEEDRQQSFDKASMGIGGRITQDIRTDENTVDYYHEKPSALLVIYLALTEQFEAIMKKGKRQDANKKDRFVHSGHIGKIAVPLIS